MNGSRLAYKVARYLCLLLTVCFVIYPSRQHASEAQYSYDDLGRLTAVVDDAGNTAVYNYDAVGNLTRTTDATGASVYSQYDALGRVTAVVSPTESFQSVSESGNVVNATLTPMM